MAVLYLLGGGAGTNVSSSNPATRARGESGAADESQASKSAASSADESATEPLRAAVSVGGTGSESSK
jgi:hypothetical protein